VGQISEIVKVGTCPSEKWLFVPLFTNSASTQTHKTRYVAPNSQYKIGRII
jgi:hypothetical protein